MPRLAVTRLVPSLALACATAALISTPASAAFSRLHACQPQYRYQVIRDAYGEQKLAKYYRDVTCKWTIVSYAPVPHNKAATRR